MFCFWVFSKEVFKEKLKKVKIVTLPGQAGLIRKTFVYIASIILELGQAGLCKRGLEALGNFGGLAKSMSLDPCGPAISLTVQTHTLKIAAQKVALNLKR